MPAMPKPPSTTGGSAFDQFLAAERAQESGGNYKVVNASSGALGGYQIMPSNLPSWSRAALGHSVSASEFLSHPSEQDAIARYELKPVYDRHGAAGAAAWWYSGQTDPTKTYGHPPVYEYVREVLARIGKAGSVTANGTPADDVSGSTVTTAGLQQAGYEAVINLTPWGLPINPFKIPGWIAGRLGKAGGDAASGALSGMWDVMGPVVLGALGVAAGVGAVLIGLHVIAKPAIDHATDQAVTVATDAAPLAV